METLAYRVTAVAMILWAAGALLMAAIARSGIVDSMIMGIGYSLPSILLAAAILVALKSRNGGGFGWAFGAGFALLGLAALGSLS